MGLLARLAGKVRCPACSSLALHSRDEERETEIRETQLALIADMSGTSLPVDPVLEALGITVWGKGSMRAYVCGSCGEAFDSDTERDWAERAKQMGDEQASAGYRLKHDAEGASSEHSTSTPPER